MSSFCNGHQAKLTDELVASSILRKFSIFVALIFLYPLAGDENLLIVTQAEECNIIAEGIFFFYIIIFCFIYLAFQFSEA